MVFSGYSLLIVCALIEYTHETFNTSESPCKDSLDICLNNVPTLKDQTKSNGIPKSKNEVDTLCKGFKMGMKCLDEYSKLCLSPEEKNIISDNIIGAKYTFKFLCDDKVFQKDYLKYTKCYQVINSDWDKCSVTFMSLVRKEMNFDQSEKIDILDVCCAKQGFLNCVYTKSKLKCGKEEAIFVKQIAETLTENKLVSPMCQHIKMNHCSTAQQTAYNIFIITLNVLYIILRY